MLFKLIILFFECKFDDKYTINLNRNKKIIFYLFPHKQFLKKMQAKC